MSALLRTGCVCCKSVIRRYSDRIVKDTQLDKLKIKPAKKQSRKILKLYHFENKKLFGDLIETAAQKRRRELKEPVKSEGTSGFSTEIWRWQNSSTNTFRIEREKGKQLVSETELNTHEQYIKSTNPKADSKAINHSKHVLQCENLHVANEGLKHNASQATKHCGELPNILVKNLASFPLENYSKNCFDNLVCKSDILSIPLNRSKDESKISYPSVSKILNSTMSDSSRAALERWKERLIEELGQDGFLKYQNELLNNGKLLHSAIQQFLSGTNESNIVIDSAIEGCWHSLNSVLPNVSDVKVLESHVIHKQLFYHGIIDCVASFKGKPLIIEWKKSDKQKSALRNTYDAPLQVAAYLGALNFDLNYNFKVSGGMVVVAYTDGSPAHVHFISQKECLRYWQMWLERLKLFWNENEKLESREISFSTRSD